MEKLNSLQSSFTSGTWTQEACLVVFYMVFTVASLTHCPEVGVAIAWRLDPESRKRYVSWMSPGCGGPQWKDDGSMKLGMSRLLSKQMNFCPPEWNEGLLSKQMNFCPPEWNEDKKGYSGLAPGKKCQAQGVDEEKAKYFRDFVYDMEGLDSHWVRKAENGEENNKAHFKLPETMPRKYSPGFILLRLHP
ncbi:hypothetical protein E5288_WYG008978 [Bos mutus]|uniref:Uncharacterized protein n=1 Tax=Bos mutus TaxID=72004 RepID=A0A6B0QW95_9CETA|nr:hypothetical protein [Bos mutus]